MLVDWCKIIWAQFRGLKKQIVTGIKKKKVEFQNSWDSRAKSQISSNYAEKENANTLLLIIFFKKHEEKKQAGFLRTGAAICYSQHDKMQQFQQSWYSQHDKHALQYSHNKLEKVKQMEGHSTIHRTSNSKQKKKVLKSSFS
jgi:hypothetical protein